MIYRETWLEIASDSGFEIAGVTPPLVGEGQAAALMDWLNHGFHGEMKWLKDSAATRIHPPSLMASAECVLVLGSHYSSAPYELEGGGKISAYAKGRDYHRALKKKLISLKKRLAKVSGTGDLDARIAVDSAPVMEKALGASAGLGWFGKQSQLINEHLGPWFYLSELFLPIELEPTSPVSSACGKCNACLNACPTGAIVFPGIIDSRKCISYWTIESGSIPPRSLRLHFKDWFFGCDECTRACPFGKRASPVIEAPFIHPFLQGKTLADFIDMEGEEFETASRGSPLRRPGMYGLKRNAVIAGCNIRNEEIIPRLEKLASHPRPNLRALAAWGLGTFKAGKALLERMLWKEKQDTVRREIIESLETM